MLVFDSAAGGLQIPEQCPPEILDLIHDCMVKDAAMRPTAKVIFDRLKARPEPWRLPRALRHDLAVAAASGA